MIESVTYSSEEGSIPENLRTTCKQLRFKGGREEEHWMRTFMPEEAIPAGLEDKWRLMGSTEGSIATIE